MIPSCFCVIIDDVYKRPFLCLSYKPQLLCFIKSVNCGIINASILQLASNSIAITSACSATKSMRFSKEVVCLNF